MFPAVLVQFVYYRAELTHWGSVLSENQHAGSLERAAKSFIVGAGDLIKPPIERPRTPLLLRGLFIVHSYLSAVLQLQPFDLCCILV